jgi:hypothetical protein
VPIRRHQHAAFESALVAELPWRYVTRAYRAIATLCSLQIICFLLLTHLEANFLMFHLYQTILLMLFYMEDHPTFLAESERIANT